MTAVASSGMARAVTVSGRTFQLFLVGCNDRGTAGERTTRQAVGRMNVSVSLRVANYNSYNPKYLYLLCEA